LLLLDEKGPLGIMEIALRLRLSHPLIIRLTSALSAAGYVRLNSDPEDGRRKVVSITPAGRREVAKIHEINRIIEAAFQRLFDESGVDLLAALEKFEAALEAESFEKRLEAEGSKQGREPAKA
jgi:DNA-binding MarR family transcriptional regulator